MNSNTFAAVPTMQCYSPAKTFANADDTLRYAKTAAKQYGVSSAVWERVPRLRKLWTFPAAK